MANAKYKKKSGLLSIFQSLINTLKPSLTKQIFEKSIERTSGYEVEEENPDNLINDKGDKNLDIYDAMLLDDRIKMAIDLKKRLTLSVPASIVPASEEEKDVEIAEEIEQQLKFDGTSKYKHAHTFNFWSSIDNLMDALAYGYKVAEKVWEIQDSKLVLHDLKYKHSRFYDFNYDQFANFNEIILAKDFGFTDRIEGADNVYDKFLIGTYPYAKDGNMYGNSVLMSVYRPWRSKLHVAKQRDITLEKWGSPVPEALYDASKMSPTEKGALKDLLDNFQEGTYLLNPGYTNPKTGELVGKIKFTIHEVKSGNIGKAFTDAIDQLDKQITRGILFPDKLGFSESPGGSYNQAETQLEVLQVEIEYHHQWIESIINLLIEQIVDANFAGVENYPVLRFNRISDKIKAEMLEKLVNLGIVDKRESWIRQHVGIPVLDEKEKEAIEKSKEEDKKKAQENMPPAPPPPGQAPEPLPEKGGEKKEGENNNPQKNKRAVCFQKKGNPFPAEKTKKWMDGQEEAFVIDYSRIMKDNYEAIIKQIEKKKIVENADYKAKATLRMPKQDLKRYFTNTFSEWYFTGKKFGIKEIDSRVKKVKKTDLKKFKLDGTTTIEGEFTHGHEYKVDDTGNGSTTATNGEGKAHVHEIMNFVVLPSGVDEHTHMLNITFKQENFVTEIDWLDRVFIDRFLGSGDLSNLTGEDKAALKEIRNRGFFITGIEEEKALKEVSFIIDSGIRSGATTKQVIAQIREKAKQITDAHALTIARTNLSMEYNNGRMNLFTSKGVVDTIEAYQYQAIMDENTTQFCASHDGQIIKASDGQTAQITPPNHFNCRSTLVPIMVGDNDEEDSFFHNYKTQEEPFGTGIPKTATQPEIGFGGSGNK